MNGRRAEALLAALLAALLVFAIVRLAWLGDDAYISLRTVENWLAGRGLVWNPGERVQTYTHPLWLLLLAGARALTGEGFFTTIWLGIGCSALAVAVLARRGIGGAAAAAAVAALLLAAPSFAVYATSGLENPLAYLLLALLLAAPDRDGAPRVRAVAWFTALLAVTRYDLALLAGPALLAAARGAGLRTALGPALLGLLPFTAWFLFAAFYYATPFPVTAYAKAFCPGIPAGELIAQGCHYLGWLAVREPALLAVLGVGIVLGLWRRALRCRALAAGALLYTLYAVRVGGDFMAGRLLTPPFVVAAAIVGRFLAARRSRWSALAIAIAGALLLAGGAPAWLRSPAAELAAIAAGPPQLDHGILDERANYWPALGLWSPARSVPESAVFSDALRATGRTRPYVMLWGQVGRFAFEAGDLVHIVDPWLCDPLLMRLPVRAGPWRIGHFLRGLPAGWLETLAHGEDRLAHQGLAAFAATLQTAIRAPLFADERFAAAWRLWTGADGAGLDAFIAGDYRAPPRVEVPLAALEPQAPVGTQWSDDPRARAVGEGGLAVRLPAPAAARALRVRVQPNLVYRLRLLRGDTPVAEAMANATNLAALLAEPGVTEHLQRIARQAPGFFDLADLRRSTNGLTLLVALCIGMRDVEVPLPAGTGAFDRVLVDIAEFQPANFGIGALGGLALVP
jgi:arabinofuranosyltransferase